MTGRLTLEEIRDYWTAQAREHGTSHVASWSDLPVIDLEVKELLARIADGDRVLDVGCANGFSTVRLAAQRRVRVRGLDYVPEMIAQAKARLPGLAGRLIGEVEFDVGDITSLREPDAAYDKVVVVRVLINLASWEAQACALAECARVLRPDGTLLLSEATVQGWRNLNLFRAEWGLSEIPMPGFNLYLDQDRVAESAAGMGLNWVQVCDVASTYFVVTRVLKPILAGASGAPVGVADPASQLNRWASQIPAWGDYGTQKLFVFRKKG